MSQFKFLILLILCCFLLGIDACSPQPPDIYAFEHLGSRVTTDAKTGHLILSPSPTCMQQIQESECGRGVSIVSGKEIFVGEQNAHLFNGKPWSKVRDESIYLPAVESYAPLATYIINSCKKMGCSSDVDKFKVKLNFLNVIENEIHKL